MAAAALGSLGLVVRQGAWQGRSGREQLDVAIAAASMGVSLALFFTDEGMLQLLAHRSPAGAGLPPAASAWTAVAEMGAARFHVPAVRYREFRADGFEFLVDVEAVSPADMLTRQSGCDRLLVT